MNCYSYQQRDSRHVHDLNVAQKILIKVYLKLGEKSLFFEHFCQDSQFHPPSLGHTYHRWQRHYYGRCQFLTSRCLSCRPHLVFFPYGFLVYCESSTLEKEGGGQKKWFLEFKSHLSHLMAK